MAVATDEGICELRYFRDDSNSDNIHYPTTSQHPHHDTLRHQLEEYFAGTRKEFDVSLVPEGTSFQKKVWDLLLEIPCGQTCSYLHLARKAGDGKMTRAVAQALAHNPIMILIPCHRAISIKGDLTGYAGGLHAKQFLLRLEGALKLQKQYRLEFPE
jgi:methylated-DNA-[protein]-cysteine S-methyltransferase